jgi:hypothetical protein
LSVPAKSSHLLPFETKDPLPSYDPDDVWVEFLDFTYDSNCHTRGGRFRAEGTFLYDYRIGNKPWIKNQRFYFKGQVVHHR